MTVTYSATVATSSFACFLKLLLRWRASMYKLVWKEFLIFLTAFYAINFVYRFALNESQKRVFEKISRYCEEKNNLIPVAFVLGFYVSVVLGRWWEQFNNIPWPDRMALFVTANMHGQDDRGRLMRRTLMRYLCLSFLITMSSISPPIKKRFPSNQHVVDAGFMNPNEEKVLSEIDTAHNKYFVPLAWATSLITRARKENRIKDDFAVKTLIDEINGFRGALGTLFNYDWMSIPLVYTQVVTLAVYSFFLSCLMGRQLVEDSNTADIFVPVFTFLQFFFYMGWLKVAETLVNPFGGDDDDFEVNTLIDRNLQVSYLIVDEMHSEHPELIKDQYWDETNFDLPYTEASINFKDKMHMGSAHTLTVSPKDAEVIQSSELASISEEGGEGIHIPAGNSNSVYRSSYSRSEKPRFLNRLFRRQNSNMSRGSWRPSTGRQLSEASTIIPETPNSQRQQPHFPGSNRNLHSEEGIFEMSDLESVSGRPVSTEMTVHRSEDVIDGASSRPPSTTERRKVQNPTKCSQSEPKPGNNDSDSDKDDSDKLLVTASARNVLN